MSAQKSDPQLYDYSPYRGRSKLSWPEGKTCAVWVAPNLEFYELDPPANPHRKSWPKPHPDVVGYCLLYTSPSPRDRTRSRMPSSA